MFAHRQTGGTLASCELVGRLAWRGLWLSPGSLLSTRDLVGGMGRELPWPRAASHGVGHGHGEHRPVDLPLRALSRGRRRAGVDDMNHPRGRRQAADRGRRAVHVAATL